jgi:hypothetical protein
MDSCSAFLDEYHSHGFERVIVTATELADLLDIKPVFKETRKRKQNQLFDYEGEDEAVFLDPKEKLRVESFLTTVDMVQNVCDERFALLRQYVDTWGFLFDMTVVPCDEDLRKACGDLAIALTDGEFRNISGDELFQELKSFHVFYITLDMPSTPLDELKYLVKFSLFDVFPNLWIALRILLTLLMSVASGERSFSHLKLIQNYLLSTMGQSRLNELGLLSIENDVVRRIDFTDVISSLANEKSRKGNFFNLVVLALAYSVVFWCLHMYIHVMLYVYCCKYCLWLP